MTNKDEQNFKKADECHICGKNILIKIVVLVTIVISLENLEAQLIKIATIISN